MFFCQAEKAIRCAMARKDFNANEMKLVIEDVMGETPLDNPKLKQVVEKIDAMTGWKSIKASVKEHTVYNGIKQTVIQRPKLLEVA